MTSGVQWLWRETALATSATVARTLARVPETSARVDVFIRCSTSQRAAAKPVPDGRACIVWDLETRRGGAKAYKSAWLELLALMQVSQRVITKRVRSMSAVAVRATLRSHPEHPSHSETQIGRAHV